MTMLASRITRARTFAGAIAHRRANATASASVLSPPSTGR